MNAARIIDTLEELIATAGMMTGEQIADAIQGTAIWVDANAATIDLESLEKIDRLQDKLQSKAA